MRLPRKSQPLRLAAHVRACENDGVVILLDLRRNKYLGIGRALSSALAPHVEGWPGRPECAVGSAPPASLEPLAGPLVAQGVLTSAVTLGQPEVIALPEAHSSLEFERTESETAIGARRFGRFLHSAATTALWMRFRSLHAIATSVAARRDRLQNANHDSREAALEAAIAYERLRPFALTAHEKCLHDSLSLVAFLAAESVIARWVIGVKTQPFGAHSWVQKDTTVLNDQHENVRQFRPILVV